jgi:hypothetical protein
MPQRGERFRSSNASVICQKAVSKLQYDLLGLLLAVMSSPSGGGRRLYWSVITETEFGEISDSARILDMLAADQPNHIEIPEIETD